MVSVSVKSVEYNIDCAETELWFTVSFICFIAKQLLLYCKAMHTCPWTTFSFLLFASTLRPTLGFHRTAESQNVPNIHKDHWIQLSSTQRQTQFLCLIVVSKHSLSFGSSGLCLLLCWAGAFPIPSPPPYPPPLTALHHSLRPYSCHQRAELSVFPALLHFYSANPYLLVFSVCLPSSWDKSGMQIVNFLVKTNKQTKSLYLNTCCWFLAFKLLAVLNNSHFAGFCLEMMLCSFQFQTTIEHPMRGCSSQPQQEAYPWEHNGSAQNMSSILFPKHTLQLLSVYNDLILCFKNTIVFVVEIISTYSE